MNRSQLEHIIRAAAGLTNEYELVIIGSQSILGSFETLPDELTRSMEADVYPLRRPELADLIDGSIGEGSPFHESFHYYAQGVGPETALLAPGWQDRLVKVQNVNTDLKIGWCLSPEDLAASKLAAGRDKDWAFVRCMFDIGLVDRNRVLDLLEQVEPNPGRLASIRRWAAGSSSLPPGPSTEGHP